MTGRLTSSTADPQQLRTRLRTQATCVHARLAADATAPSSFQLALVASNRSPSARVLLHCLLVSFNLQRHHRHVVVRRKAGAVLGDRCRRCAWTISRRGRWRVRSTTSISRGGRELLAAVRSSPRRRRPSRRRRRRRGCSGNDDLVVRHAEERSERHARQLDRAAWSSPLDAHRIRQARVGERDGAPLQVEDARSRACSSTPRAGARGGSC